MLLLQGHGTRGAPSWCKAPAGVGEEQSKEGVQEDKEGVEEGKEGVQGAMRGCRGQGGGAGAQASTGWGVIAEHRLAELCLQLLLFREFFSG